VIVRLGVVALAAALCTACSNPGAWGTAHADPPNNAAALDDVAAGRGGEEVVVAGTVMRVYAPRRSSSGVHERFVLALTGSSARMLVADNLTIGQAAPLHAGDHVIVKGVLELDPSGPVIHWTHHDPRFRHPGGYIEVGGKVYE
jgi:hypothetical protein